MKTLKIVHETTYTFTSAAELLPHTFRLQPREGHELRIESSSLSVSPPAILRWHRDTEGNSIALASFTDKTRVLHIRSEVIIQKFDVNPLDFLVANHAINYPFRYQDEEYVSLQPYIDKPKKLKENVAHWLLDIWNPDDSIQTIELLSKINRRISQESKYIKREEEGVQSAESTLATRSGSCRDFASLFMFITQQLGFAARFVSGYVFSEGDDEQEESTHAWAEVFIPGAGWKGYDPTLGIMAGVDHIATAVARKPELIPPISGKYLGSARSSMAVKVSVSEVSNT